MQKAMIKTVCPKCGQALEAGNEYAGQIVDCPHCGESVAFPEMQNAFAPQAIPQRKSAPTNNPEMLDRLVPRKSVAIHYLLPILVLVVGAVLFFTGVSSLLIGLFVFVVILGHLGAIAARLKTIEELLRVRR